MVRADWDVLSQIREEVFFTRGRIIVRGKLVTRGKAKFADYILYYKPNIPMALIEAKDNNHPVGGGMQQGLDYAVNLDFKNPHAVADDHGDPEELLAKLDEAEKQAAALREQLKAALAEALLR